MSQLADQNMMCFTKTSPTAHDRAVWNRDQAWIEACMNGDQAGIEVCMNGDQAGIEACMNGDQAGIEACMEWRPSWDGSMHGMETRLVWKPWDEASKSWGKSLGLRPT